MYSNLPNLPWLCVQICCDGAQQFAVLSELTPRCRSVRRQRAKDVKGAKGGKKAVAANAGSTGTQGTSRRAAAAAPPASPSVAGLATPSQPPFGSTQASPPSVAKPARPRAAGAARAAVAAMAATAAPAARAAAKGKGRGLALDSDALLKEMMPQTPAQAVAEPSCRRSGSGGGGTQSEDGSAGASPGGRRRKGLLAHLGAGNVGMQPPKWMNMQRGASEAGLFRRPEQSARSAPGGASTSCVARGTGCAEADASAARARPAKAAPRPRAHRADNGSRADADQAGADHARPRPSEAQHTGGPAHAARDAIASQPGEARVPSEKRASGAGAEGKPAVRVGVEASVDLTAEDSDERAGPSQARRAAQSSVKAAVQPGPDVDTAGRRQTPLSPGKRHGGALASPAKAQKSVECVDLLGDSD